MVTTTNKPADLSDWEDALVEIAEIRETLTALQEDRPDDVALEDFAAGVLETLESMASWIEAHCTVTEKQLAAIANMSAAVGKWERA